MVQQCEQGHYMIWCDHTGIVTGVSVCANSLNMSLFNFRIHCYIMLWCRWILKVWRARRRLARKKSRTTTTTTTTATKNRSTTAPKSQATTATKNRVTTATRSHVTTATKRRATTATKSCGHATTAAKSRATTAPNKQPQDANKIKRFKWTEADMEAAVNAVASGSMSQRVKNTACLVQLINGDFTCTSCFVWQLTWISILC